MDEKKLAKELYEENPKDTGKAKKSRLGKILRRTGRGTKTTLGTLGPVGIGAGVWQGIYQSMVSVTSQLDIISLPVEVGAGKEEIWNFPTETIGYVHEVVFKQGLKKIPFIGQYLFDFVNGIQLKLAEGYVPQFFKPYMDDYAGTTSESFYYYAINYKHMEPRKALEAAFEVYKKTLADPKAQHIVRDYIKNNVGMEFAMYDMAKIEATIGALIVAGALLYHNREDVKDFAKTAYRGLDRIYKKTRRDKNKL